MAKKRMTVKGMSIIQAKAFIEEHNINDAVEFCEVRAKKEGVEMTLAEAGRLFDAAVEMPVEANVPVLYFVAFVGGTEPETEGPFPSEALRVKYARKWWAEFGDYGSIAKLDIDATGKPSVSPFIGDELD